MPRLRVSLALAALLVAAQVSAEPLGSHYELTPFGGYLLFDSKLRPSGSDPLRDAVYSGARFAWFTRPWLGVELAGGVSPTNEDRLGGGGADVNFIHASGGLILSPWSARTGGPYLLAGMGGARLRPAGVPALTMGNLELGGGVRLWLTDRVGVRLEARDLHWIPNSTGLNSTDNVLIGGGITFAFGGIPRDTDGDGVPDKLDACPDTPKGAKVDAKGCPIDSDGDGVYDGLDQCPGTPKGCTVDASGCPKDSDGDGVCDGLDKCPDTSPGLKVDASGCPIEVVERETELLDTGMIRLQNVNFETNKADVLPESYPTLDVVGQVLTKWPELKIEVGGHTDSRGSDAHNLRLSQARADSVLTYLTRKFPNLKADQFTVKGYGESRPLVPNTNPLNMAKNRRVEFVVQNKDVLRRESERRRLLRQGEGAPPDTTHGAAPDMLRRGASPDTLHKTAPPDTLRKAAPPDTTRR